MASALTRMGAPSSQIIKAAFNLTCGGYGDQVADTTSTPKLATGPDRQMPVCPIWIHRIAIGGFACGIAAKRAVLAASAHRFCPACAQQQLALAWWLWWWVDGSDGGLLHAGRHRVGTFPVDSYITRHTTLARPAAHTRQPLPNDPAAVRSNPLMISTVPSFS
jgi:hypothetical protein